MKILRHEPFSLDEAVATDKIARMGFLRSIFGKKVAPTEAKRSVTTAQNSDEQTEADRPFVVDMPEVPARVSAGCGTAAVGNKQRNGVLLCTWCGETYEVGQDSILVAAESAYSLVGKTLVVRDNNAQLVDLVSKLDDVAPERLQEVKENAIRTWRTITDGPENQRRVWRCHKCNAFNAYRIRGMISFYPRLSPFLSPRQISNGEFVCSAADENTERMVKTLRTAEGILHELILGRVLACQDCSTTDARFCSYQRADPDENVGFLRVHDKFRSALEQEWAKLVLERTSVPITQMYGPPQINELFDNALFAINGIVPDYFLIDNWGETVDEFGKKHTVMNLAAVVPEADFGKIKWSPLFGGTAYSNARARMFMAHLTKLATQDKIEVYLQRFGFNGVDDALYLAAS